ncbi:MAG: glycosyltransferase [Caulobacteraceae bacterium]|nr:glycosyltransferase [Caulobacteraceae bacterium]
MAVLVPCFNEATTIAKVVRDFTAALPEAKIYVYDNNSTDETSTVAGESGALVRRATLPGKGNVVRRMFADVQADVYLLVDGDDTYDASAAPGLVRKLLEEGLDMVSAARVSSHPAAYRPGHAFGNKMLSGLVRQMFGRQFKDMLTGYRAFSRRFVKSFPANSAGFEIETEITVHALQMRLPAEEVEAGYGARPDGSESKLNTLADGWRILRMISLLVREERPLQFFGGAALVALTLSAILGLPVLAEFARTGAVPRFPSLIVSVGLAMVAIVSFACGLILDAVARSRLEQRRLAYLALPAGWFVAGRSKTLER